MPLFGKKGDGNQPSSVFVVGAVDQSPPAREPAPAVRADPRGAGQAGKRPSTERYRSPVS
jgi:hypothetical protein